jgi:hypothetical protein
MFGSKIVNPASKSLTPPRAQGLHPADALARTQREHGEQHQRQTHSTEPECDSLTPPSVSGATDGTQYYGYPKTAITNDYHIHNGPRGIFYGF